MVTALLSWIIVGLVAGFLASTVMRGGGYGCVGDMIVGIVGALIGGFFMSLIGLNSSGNIIYSIIVAFIGACILISILRAISSSTTRERRLYREDANGAAENIRMAQSRNSPQYLTTEKPAQHTISPYQPMPTYTEQPSIQSYSSLQQQVHVSPSEQDTNDKQAPLSLPIDNNTSI